MTATIKGYTKFIFDGKAIEAIHIYTKRYSMNGYRIIIDDIIQEINGDNHITTMDIEYFNIVFDFYDETKEFKINRVPKYDSILLFFPFVIFIYIIYIIYIKIKEIGKKFSIYRK